MKITEEFIRRFATRETLRKGRLAYLKGAVTLKEVGERRVLATVRDGKTYTVEFTEPRKGRIDSSCTCPFDWQGECAHIVAAAYAAMQNGTGSKHFARRKRVSTTMIPLLYLRDVDGVLTVELRFEYQGYEVPPLGAEGARLKEAISSVVTGDQLVEILRDEQGEREAQARLRASLLGQPSPDKAPQIYVPTIHPVEWLTDVLQELQSEGFRVFGKEYVTNYRIRSSKPAFSLKVSSGIDWLDLEGRVAFENAEADFADVVRALERREKFVQLSDGSYGVLPQQWIRKFEKLVLLGRTSGNSLRVSNRLAALVDDAAEEADEEKSDEGYQKIVSAFRRFDSIKPAPLPGGFIGVLRPYQKAGFDWLHFLHEFNFGGILADDMGLGKTVQTLAFLQRMYESGSPLPSLVVVPTSIVYNWMNEAQRFTPTLKIFPYRGMDRRDHLDEFREYQVIVTSYGILRRDIEILKKFYFSYVVLDESQFIKNYNSVTARAVRQLNADHRLALSGTPVENNLMELWSQFAFLNPGMLGTHKMFLEQFAKPIEKDANEAVEQTLRRIVFPFILRRTKEFVARDLPPKVETTLYCELTPSQRAVYGRWKDYYRKNILSKIEEQGLKKSKLLVLEGLMRLRQICCHPQLVDPSSTAGSGKFEAYSEMLGDVLAEGHKVLVFSQFVKMLAILRRYLDHHKIPYEYLDGRTIDRESRVNRFQKDKNIRVFLISLRAGGLGLNLTAADYVIHYDPWWNPAVEMQATDRTHRIGQKKSVFSYKLITKDSIEEKILRLQEKKKELVANIIATDAELFKKLTKDDVAELFE